MWDDDMSRGTRTQLVRTTKYLSLRLRRVVRYKKLPHTKYALIVWCHQAPLTPPSFAYHTTLLRDPCMRRNRFSAFGESCRLFPFRCLHATRPPPTLRYPTPEHGFRTSQPAVRGHHPPPLRSPDDRLVVALFDLTSFVWRRLTDKSVRLLNVTYHKARVQGVEFTRIGTSSDS